MPNLKWLKTANQARWPWLQRVDPSRPWAEFKIQVPKESLQLFRAAAHAKLKDGKSTLFWEDGWLDGRRV